MIQSISKSVLYLGLIFAASASLMPARAQETVLWNLTFNDLTPGAPLVPSNAGSAMPSAPQTVGVDADNTLIGAQAFEDLKDSPLIFTKATTKPHTPKFELLCGATGP